MISELQIVTYEFEIPFEFLEQTRRPERPYSCMFTRVDDELRDWLDTELPHGEGWVLKTSEPLRVCHHKGVTGVDIVFTDNLKATLFALAFGATGATTTVTAHCEW